MASRNQREGKYIPGWCYNPAYKLVPAASGTLKGSVKLVPKTRAGKHHNLTGVRNFHDGVARIPGMTFIRTYRMGAFE